MFPIALAPELHPLRDDDIVGRYPPRFTSIKGICRPRVFMGSARKRRGSGDQGREGMEALRREACRRYEYWR